MTGPVPGSTDAEPVGPKTAQAASASPGSAIMATLQQVAGAAGTALFVTVMAVASTGATAGADVAGARAAFMVAAIIATIALPLTFLVGAGASRPPVVQADGAVRKGGRPDE